MFHEVAAQISSCAVSGSQEGLTGIGRSSAKMVSSQAWQTWSDFWQEASHVQMWELDHKEGWAQKNWCFWTVVLEKTLESPLDSKEIKPINPKGNQNTLNIHWEDWLFIAEAEALILWPLDAKRQLTGKDLNAGKDWGQEETAVTENKIVGWHYDSVDMSLSKLWEVVKVREA